MENQDCESCACKDSFRESNPRCWIQRGFFRAASSVGLGCLVAKLQFLIITHQVSPVNAGLHPDAKYTHTCTLVLTFSLPDRCPPLCPLLAPCKLPDVQHVVSTMLRRAGATSLMSGSVGVACWRPLDASLPICASWCVAIFVQGADEGEQIRGRY